MSTAEDTRQATALARVPALVAQFSGQIKYLPMLLDHPDWSDEQCLEFARRWDAIARERHAVSDQGWNNGIPYARNIWKD